MLRKSVVSIGFSLAAFGALSIFPTSANAADIVKVHLPFPGIESMPFLLANDLGFYSDKGIQFDRHAMKVDLGVMAVVGGQVDVTQILGLSLRGAIERGADLRIAMVFNTLPIYSFFVRKPIKSYQELKGEKIASSTNGASATKVLRVTLEENGLNPDKDVNIFYIGETPTRFQSIVSGAVAASVLLAPFDIAALANPALHQLPFANKPGVLMVGVAASKKFLFERPEVSRRFLRATWDGLGYLISNRDESVKVMAKYLGVDLATASKTYDTWIDRFSPDGAMTPEFINQVLEFEFGKATPEMASKAFDFSVVRSFAKN